jgi:hypothetical protein
MASQRLQGIQNLLWPQGTGHNVWAIVGARPRVSWSRTSPILASMVDPLYPELEAVAPSLIQPYVEDRFTQRMILGVGRRRTPA